MEILDDVRRFRHRDALVRVDEDGHGALTRDRLYLVALGVEAFGPDGIVIESEVVQFVDDEFTERAAFEPVENAVAHIWSLDAAAHNPTGAANPFVASERPVAMPPAVGDTRPEFTALYCDGETFRERKAHDLLDDGGVLVFAGFAFNAIHENWWKQYARTGWDEFDVPVVPVVRDGPYAVNAFLRDIDVPFDAVADVEGTVADAYDLLVEREGMAGTRTARRSVFVVDETGDIQFRWLADDWISPVPREEIEDAVAGLA